MEGLLRAILKEVTTSLTYYLEHMNPMELTRKKYAYIFVVVHRFSKFIWIYPTNKMNTKEINGTNWDCNQIRLVILDHVS